MAAEDSSDGFGALTELALDLRWSWNHGTDEIWQQLDPVLWKLTRHPYAVLQAVSRGEIERRWAEPSFRAKVDALVQRRRREAVAPGWFQQAHPQTPLTHVAYFSM